MKTLIYSLLIVCIFTACKKEDTIPEFIGKNKVTLLIPGSNNLVINFEDGSIIKVPNFTEIRDEKGNLKYSFFTFKTDFNKFKLQEIINNQLQKTGWINVADTVKVTSFIFKP
jgi:hypothetical protein